MKRSISICGVFLCAAFLAACGNGDSDGGGPAVLTGIFIDSPVEGLTFSTATQGGVTDSAGTFRYQAGETITFSIGGTVVGEPVTATAVMTPRSLVPGAPLYTTEREVTRAFDRPLAAETRAFNRLINILVLLQSLDQDAVPDNGITILPATAALFAGRQIDFDIEVDDFELQIARGTRFGETDALPSANNVRRILHEAVNAGSLATAALRKPTAALDHFYAEQGISTSLARVARVETDLDPTGSPGLDSVVSYSYDSAGNLTERLHESPPGTPWRRETWTYENGRQTRYVHEDLLINQTLVDNRFTYDSNGNLTEETTDEGDGFSAIADGVSDSITTYDYNPDGSQAEVRYDFDGNGTPDFIETFTYGTDGLRTGARFDRTGQGGQLFDESYTYDDSGRIVETAQDSLPDGAPDGSPDFYILYRYDANNGRLIERGVDLDGNAAINPGDGLLLFTYDTAGHLLEWLSDRDADGAIDDASIWTYNADGNETSYCFDQLNDGSCEDTETFEYDPDGNLIRESRVHSFFLGDVPAEEVNTFAYNSDGNLEVETRDFNINDTTPPSVTSYTYDPDGNIATRTFDHGGDAVPEELTTYTYEAGNWTSLFEGETGDVDDLQVDN